jgi:cytochrome c oxidase accessory protein FixG
MKLDAAPWSWNKLRRRGARHVAWITLALWTGFTFVGFFTPIRELAARAWPFAWSGWEAFWVGFYALATWGNAGVLREQVCKYMCPYARFQSAMFDADTLIIAYDTGRGEPRGARKRGSDAAAQGLGDCIDCTICVQVCPTGIDIRNGLQYECIACGACIDACDSVMDRMGTPRGLVRYTSANAAAGRRWRPLRPRVLVYGALLLALAGGTGAAIALRDPLIVDVMRDKALYRVGSDGVVENTYTLRLINKDAAPHAFVLRVESAAPLALSGDAPVLRAGPEEVLTVPVTVRARGHVAGGADLRFVVEDVAGGVQQSAEARFLAPVSP